MPVCEQCGVTFEEPKDSVQEVTSLRVLCPSCAEERRRQKLAAKAAAAQRPAPSATPAKPAPPPAAARPPASAPAPPPATRPPARPTSPGAPAVRPAVRPAAAPPPAAARPRPAPSRAAEPAAARVRAPVRRASTGSRSELIVETGNRAKPVMDKTTKIGAAVALLLVVAAGVVFFVVKGQKTDEQRRADARAEAQSDYMEKLRALDLNNPDDAEKVRPLVIEGEDLWRGTSFAVEVQSVLAKAESFLSNNAEKQDFDTRLAGIEGQLANSAAMEPKDLAEIRRGLRNMELTAKPFGADMEARVKAALALCSREYVMKLVDAARTASTQNPDQRAALNMLALAEEELRTQLADAFKTKDEKVRTELEPLYVEMIQTSDRLSEQVFTDAYIESTQWRDLLSSAESSKWIVSKTTGFEWKITDGVMTLKGPAPDAKGQASMSIGDEEKWRDFVIEIEFTVKAGSPNLYFRAPKVIDNRVQNILIEKGDETMGDGFQLDTKYQLRVTFIGNRFVAVCSDEQAFQPLNDTSEPGESRRGAFAMAIPKGAQFEVSKLRIKVLR